MIRTTILYSGRVQGIGFRATTAHIASNFDITGWVRNESDSTVRLVAQGNSQTVSDFLDTIQQEFSHNIDHTDISHTQDCEPLEGFSIRL